MLQRARILPRPWCSTLLVEMALSCPPIWISSNLHGIQYCQILDHKVFPVLHHKCDAVRPRNRVWQQDGTPYHTSKAMQRCLKQKLGSKRLWPKLFWPPFSPDLNPLDYHLCMHVAERACTTSHPNVDALKASVDQEWATMRDTDLIEVIKDFWHLRYNISWIVLAQNAPKTHFHILTTSSTVSTRCSQGICSNTVSLLKDLKAGFWLASKFGIISGVGGLCHNVEWSAVEVILEKVTRRHLHDFWTTRYSLSIVHYVHLANWYFSNTQSLQPKSVAKAMSACKMSLSPKNAAFHVRLSILHSLCTYNFVDAKTIILAQSYSCSCWLSQPSEDRTRLFILRSSLGWLQSVQSCCRSHLLVAEVLLWSPVSADLCFASTYSLHKYCGKVLSNLLSMNKMSAKWTI